jgi:DNA-binding transcriptional MocR family regulator
MVPAGRDRPTPSRDGTHATRLDPYADRYAERTAGMQASEIRALFAVASRPEVVSLAGGMPNISGLPLDAVADSVSDLVLRLGNVALQYSSGQGDPALRQSITALMALEGIVADPDNVVVTVGSQQGLDLVTRIFCDPGDVVLCEAPAYVGALGVFSASQVDVVQIAMDDDGLIPAALSEAVDRVAAAGKRAKFLYTVPNFSNPAGVTLSAARRSKVLELCAAADVLVVEDNPYGLLHFESPPPLPLRASDGERVVYLGTFSKTFAPGFRVGWVLAPLAIRQKLVLAQESATLCPPTFSQLAVRAYLDRCDWQRQIKDFIEMYRERRDALLGALTEHLPGSATWTVPTGGFYVWLRLPSGLDSKAMLPRAVTARVAYVPGSAFYADGSGRRYLRLSYCYPPPERIVEGVRRLSGVVRAELELHDTFGAGGAAAAPSQYDRPRPDLT